MDVDRNIIYHSVNLENMAILRCHQYCHNSSIVHLCFILWDETQYKIVGFEDSLKIKMSDYLGPQIPYILLQEAIATKEARRKSPILVDCQQKKLDTEELALPFWITPSSNFLQTWSL